MTPAIPSWKDRLRACFRMRQRAMHVFGIPAAIGSAVAVGVASVLTPEAGLSLGVLSAGVGSLLVGYYVVAGFDHGVVRMLQDEERTAAKIDQIEGMQLALRSAPDAMRPALESIISQHLAIEAEFEDDESCPVEAILANSRADITALRDRAVSLIDLYNRIERLLAQSDADRLRQELERLQLELDQTQDPTTIEALESARASTQRALEQRGAAEDKRTQIRSLMTMIDSNIKEFKLTMELRKTDAALGKGTTAPEVSELQARLVAAGQACDQLMGGGARSARRVRAGGSGT